MSPTTTSKPRKCGHCHEPGHTKRKCPLLAAPPPTPDAGSNGKSNGGVFDFEGAAAPEADFAIPGIEDPSPEYRADVDAVLDEALAGAKENAGELDPNEVIALERKVIEKWDTWRKALKDSRHVAKETRDAELGAEGNFREAVEDKESPATLEKLKRIEKLWAAWQTMRQGGVETRATARRAVKASAKALEDAVENARQMVLPGVDR